MNLAGAFIRAAVALLPPSERNRFLAEWTAEHAAVVQDNGPAAGRSFAARLPGAAIEMTKTIRANSSSAYLEFSVASLTGLLPTFVLAAWSVNALNWTMFGSQLIVGIGIVLVAGGVWRYDGRLLDSTWSRIGFALVLAGSMLSTWHLQRGDVSLLADQRMSVTLPNTIILLGLAMLVASNYAGRSRGRLQQMGLYMMAPGALLLLVVAIVNALNTTGASRIIQLVFALPAFVLAWACSSIAGRSRVFDDVRSGVEA